MKAEYFAESAGAQLGIGVVARLEKGAVFGYESAGMKAKRRASLSRLREEIHDELGPRLFAVAAKLTFLREKLSGKARAELAAIGSEVQALRDEVRRITRGEEAAMATDLAGALRALAREIGATFRRERGETGVGADATRDLYGIAREAAHNAVKHAAARRIVIRLGPGRVSVEDDGIGLRDGWKDGVGMKLMKGKARRVGGCLTLQRVAPHGTIVACIFRVTGARWGGSKSQTQPHGKQRWKKSAQNARVYS